MLNRYEANDIFERLGSSTIADPLLLYQFIYICSVKEFNGLIPGILPFLSIAFKAKMLVVNKEYNPNEVMCVIYEFNA